MLTGLSLVQPAFAASVTASGTVWNAASNANFTVTGGLTATRSGGAGDQNIRATVTRTSGYFEVQPTFASGGVSIGLCEASFAASTSPGQDLNSVGYEPSGSVFVAGSGPVATYSTYASTDVIGVCLKGGNIYYSKNGVWQGGSDPSAGTGGISVSAAITNAIPVASCNSNAGQTLLGCFTTGFAGTIPTGVSAWS